MLTFPAANYKNSLNCQTFAYLKAALLRALRVLPALKLKCISLYVYLYVKNIVLCLILLISSSIYWPLFKNSGLI